MTYFARRSKSMIFVLLAMAGGPAAAQTITLDCVGEPTQISHDGKPRQPDEAYYRSYHHIFYIDLVAQRYCEDTCQNAQKLVKVNSDIIDMSWSSPKDQVINYSGGQRKFFRKTGEFVSDETYSFGSWRRFKVQGRCSATLLETVPIIKFLSDAQNQ